MDKRPRSSDDSLYHSPHKDDLINHCLYDIAYDKFGSKDLKTIVPGGCYWFNSKCSLGQNIIAFPCLALRGYFYNFPTTAYFKLGIFRVLQSSTLGSPFLQNRNYISQQYFLNCSLSDCS